jgi:hypothetical protein
MTLTSRANQARRAPAHAVLADAAALNVALRHALALILRQDVRPVDALGLWTWGDNSWSSREAEGG